MIQRSIWLVSALGGTVLATGWAALQPSESAEPTVVAVVRSPGTGSGTLRAPSPVPVDAGVAPPMVDAASPLRAAGPSVAGAENGLARGAVSEVDTPVPARGQWPSLSSDAEASWGPPPPLPPPVPPPPAREAAATPPVAPAFPYQWIGGLDDGNGPSIFLASQRRTVVLRMGETLDGVWRLDALEDGRPQFTWLPGGQTVTLDSRR